MYLPFLILREHVIDRLYDQNVGYWQPDLQGLEHLTSADRAAPLVDYLGVTEGQLVRQRNDWPPTANTNSRSLLESSVNGSRTAPSVSHAKRLSISSSGEYQNDGPVQIHPLFLPDQGANATVPRQHVTEGSGSATHFFPLCRVSPSPQSRAQLGRGEHNGQSDNGQASGFRF